MIRQIDYRGGIGGWGRDQWFLGSRIALGTVTGMGFAASKRGRRVLSGKDLTPEFVGEGGSSGAGLVEGRGYMKPWDREERAL